MSGGLFYDIAPNLTGFCGGDGKSLPVSDAWRFPPCGDDFGRLAIAMEDQVRAHVAHFDPDAVGYEAPLLLPHDALFDLRRIYGLGMELERVCIRIGEERGRPLPCAEVSHRKIKHLATGDQYAKKPAVIAAAAAAGFVLPRTMDEGRGDAADAAVGWVLLMDDIDPAAASPWIARFRGTLL